jgi:hypothetical protein
MSSTCPSPFSPKETRRGTCIDVSIEKFSVELAAQHVEDVVRDDKGVVSVRRLLGKGWYIDDIGRHIIREWILEEKCYRVSPCDIQGVGWSCGRILGPRIFLQNLFQIYAVVDLGLAPITEK